MARSKCKVEMTYLFLIFLNLVFPLIPVSNPLLLGLMGQKVRFFPSWAATILTKDGDIYSLFDPRLEGDSVDIEELTRACKVACWYIQDEESHRPSMSQVVQILEGVLEVNPPPFPRSIQALVHTDEAMVFFTDSSSSSSHNSSQKQSHSTSSQ